MKNKSYVLLLLACSIYLLSCKKDSQPQQQQQQQIHYLGKDILSFSVNGQLLDAVIDTAFKTITVTIPSNADTHNLTVNFTLANQVTATANNKALSSNTSLDISSPVSFTITAADNGGSLSFKLSAQTDLQYFGLAGAIIAHKSLNKDYAFYFDQFDGSADEAVNCGPASTTMAIKWADSTFSKKPVDARAKILPQGGWWYTGDVQNYLNLNGINSTIDTLNSLDAVIKRSIDNNNAVILCLDMFYVPFDNLNYQHIQKFYNTDAAGWGHFILIKGYMQLSSGFFLEAYDPYSDGSSYTSISVGQLKGKDRYYLDTDITRATNIWWPYAIIVAPKGQAVVAASGLRVSSISHPIPNARGR